MIDDDLPANAEDPERQPALTNLAVSLPAPTSQFEKALRESTELYSRVFENHYAILLVYDPETFYLSNALKYAGQPARIELGGELQADGLVRFWIHDNGDGIAPAKQALLCTAFYRPTSLSSGHGLGLSIVKRIIEKLGGEVAVQSCGAPGEGSTFSFTLPAA